MTKAKRAELKQYIAAHTLRVEASRRGGGIEIDVGEFLDKPFAKMTAFQNYLGGGLLGRIENDHNFNPLTLQPEDAARLAELQHVLNEHFHSLSNEAAGDYDAYNAADFENVQSRPASAY